MLTEKALIYNAFADTPKFPQKKVLTDDAMFRR